MDPCLYFGSSVCISPVSQLSLHRYYLGSITVIVALILVARARTVTHCRLSHRVVTLENNIITWRVQRFWYMLYIIHMLYFMQLAISVCLLFLNFSHAFEKRKDPAHRIHLLYPIDKPPLNPCRTKIHYAPHVRYIGVCRHIHTRASVNTNIVLGMCLNSRLDSGKIAKGI